MDELGVIRQRNYTKNQQTRDVVLKTLIIGTGNILKVYAKGKRADVTLTYADANSKPVIIRGVELLRLGTSKVGVFVEPNIGDCVVLLTTQHYLDEYKVQQTPQMQLPNASLYSNANIKGFVLQPNAELTEGTFIHIDTQNNVSITNKGKVTIICQDEVEITNEKKSTITCKDDVSITNEKKSTITCKGETTIDASGQNVTLKSSKTTVNEHLEIS